MVCIDLFLILSCKLICNEKAATLVPRKKKKKKSLWAWLNCLTSLYKCKNMEILTDNRKTHASKEIISVQKMRPNENLCLQLKLN